MAAGSDSPVVIGGRGLKLLVPGQGAGRESDSPVVIGGRGLKHEIQTANTPALGIRPS